MSVKVRGVPGENLTPGVTDQDFVLNSHPVMMAADARSFLELLRANEAGGLRRILYFLTHLKAAGIARAARSSPPATWTSPTGARRRICSGTGVP